MSDTTTIGLDEIEAVAAKVDAGEALDDHDRIVLRGVLVLAGERVAELVEPDVTGFALDPGSPGGLGAVGLGFEGSLADQASPSLFQHCCTGKHFSTVSLYLRRAGGQGGLAGG